MITVTFEPTNPEQAALLGEFLPQYMRAGQLVVTGAPADVKAVVEQAAAAAEEKAAPKSRKASKSSAPAATQEASAPEAPTPSPSPAAETSAPADEGNDTPAATSTASPAASPASSKTSVKLEDVRALLADLSQAGKGAQVKALIAETGATKLTEVPAEKYAELLEKAKAL